jgi:hypothetical protein
MMKKALAIGALFLSILFTISVSAQKRRPIRPNTTTKSPEARAARNPAPPLIPQYEAASGNNPNRVILPSSFVGNPKGATFIKMYVRYIYDNYWHQIGHLNNVSIMFGMNPKNRVCADECQFTMNIDGKEVKVNGEGSASFLASGTFIETATVWMRPEVFKTIAEAKEISVQIGSVSFNLTGQQMEGLRQMLPFLKIR